jgi:hypothetical protein
MKLQTKAVFFASFMLILGNAFAQRRPLYTANIDAAEPALEDVSCSEFVKTKLDECRNLKPSPKPGKITCGGYDYYFDDSPPAHDDQIYKCKPGFFPTSPLSDECKVINEYPTDSVGDFICDDCGGMPSRTDCSKRRLPIPTNVNSQESVY